MLLDATHCLFNWVTVQFSTMFCSSHRKEQAIEYTGSHGWDWQACAGLDPSRPSVVFLFAGFVEHGFLRGGMYVQSYLICLPVRFFLTLFLALWYICYNSVKKKEQIYSMCVVLSKSFPFQCTYYSFSPTCVIFNSDRVLSAASHVDRTAHTIELEPLTFTIVVHSKTKAERLKHYQLKMCPAWTAEVLAWCLGARVESDL